MRSAWDEAEAELRLAHDELLPHKPGGAAEASYGVGEVLRRRGDLAAAEQAFLAARHERWDRSPAWPCCASPRGGSPPPRPGCGPLASPPLVDRFAQARLLAAQVGVDRVQAPSSAAAERLGGWPPSSRPCPAR